MKDTINKNDLYRYNKAQDKVYDQVLSELRNGKKRTHWMWFIFPQISGLGKSSMAKFYSIKNKEEAVLYLKHPILRQRLEECTNIILECEGKTAAQIFGFPDNKKLKSSMTLFADISSNHNSIFHQVLTKYFNGEHDQVTLDILNV